jgi:nitric oxide reductase NorD protein
MTAPGPRLAASADARFADHHRLLTLFAQGLAGEYLHLRLLESPGARRPTGRIAPDSNSIFLPAAIGDFATVAHNLGAYRIAVLRQIGYRLEGTFDLDYQGFLSSWPRPGLLRRVFSMVENLRIDAGVRRRYPGARADLDRARAHALAQLPRPRATPLNALLEALRRFSLGAQRSALLVNDDNGMLAGVIDAAGVAQSPGAEVHDSARAALRICADLEILFNRPPRRMRSATREEDMAPATAASNGVAEDESLGEEFAEFDFQDQGGGAEVGFTGDLDFDRMFDGRSQGEVGIPVRETQPPPSPGRPDTGLRVGAQPDSPSRPGPHTHDGPRSFLYDEWDYRQQSYLPAWCRVVEHRLRGDDFGFIDDVRRRHSTLVHQVRRLFGSIKPEAWRRVRRSVDGDELELDSVIAAVIDRHAGHVGDSRVYVRRDRALRDVAAAFLVDMSASTDFPLPDPVAAAAPDEPPEDRGVYLYAGREDLPAAAAAQRRRVIDVSKEALALMCGALHTLGDSYAVYGFSGDGRENVEFHVTKDFTDKLSARTWAALAAIQPRRSTRMGAAIRHAQSKLQRETARIKLLIIISDGYPEDHDYGDDRNDREYGLQDTARALTEAERAGTVNFCVTIDKAGHDYLRRMCRESRYLVIDDVSALPRELTKVYRTLTVV